MPDYTRSYDTKFYVISQALDVDTVSSIEEIDTSIDILIILKIYTTTLFWQTNGYNKSDWFATIEMLNSEGQQAENLTNNGWEFAIFNTCSKQHSYYGNHQAFKPNFIDFFKMPNTSEVFDLSISGFIEAYKRFLKLSQHKGYKVAVLEIEKEKWLEEKESLKKEVSELKAEIVRLNEKISYFG